MRVDDKLNTDRARGPPVDRPETIETYSSLCGCVRDSDSNDVDADVDDRHAGGLV